MILKFLVNLAFFPLLRTAHSKYQYEYFWERDKDYDENVKYLMSDCDQLLQTNSFGLMQTTRLNIIGIVYVVLKFKNEPFVNLSCFCVT